MATIMFHNNKIKKFLILCLLVGATYAMVLSSYTRWHHIFFRKSVNSELLT